MHRVIFRRRLEKYISHHQTGQNHRQEAEVYQDIVANKNEVRVGASMVVRGTNRNALVTFGPFCTKIDFETIT